MASSRPSLANEQEPMSSGFVTVTTRACASAPPTWPRAGDLRAVHYHRERSAVSLADCLALATAESVGEALATPDPALAAMARAEGIEVIPLPDSRGHRP